MAPPAHTINTANSSYSRVDLTRTNTSTNKDAVELALAKAMLTRDISDFDSNASTISGERQLINGTAFNTLVKENMMVNHQENSLGTVFALAAEHKDGENGGDWPSNAYTNSSNLGKYYFEQYYYGTTNYTTKATLNEESASYYDSRVNFQVDSSEATFYDATNATSASTASNPNYKVEFTSGGQALSQNKAVNSIYSTTDGTNPLTISESSFNTSGNALFSEKQINRDSTTNAYSASSTDLTDKLSSITYVNGGSTSPLYNITLDQNASNDRFFFGAVKVDQQPNTITIDDVHSTDYGSTGVKGASNSTLAIKSTTAGITQYNTPTSLTESQFKNLFTSTDQLYLKDNYKIQVESTSEVPSGGYALNNEDNYGFSINDESLKRSVPYMETCATAGSNFDHAAHSLSIVNGDLVKNTIDGVDMNSGSPNAGIFASGPMDMAETLNVNQYATQFKVRSYFTIPSLNGQTVDGVNYKRSTAVGTPSTNFTDFRVVYNSGYEENDNDPVYGNGNGYPWAEGSWVLPADQRSRYYEKFDITTVIPSTTVNTVSSGAFNNANTVGQHSGFVAVVQDGKLGMNTVGDYTFTSSVSAATAAGNDVVLIKLENMQEMANENSLYADPNVGPITGTNVSAIGRNINLTGIAAKDLRVKLTAKTNLTGLNNGWSFQRTTGSSLVTDVSKPSIFGDKIYDITSNINNTVPLKFEVMTNGVAANRDGLTLYTKVSWGADYENIYIISQDTMNPALTLTNSTTDIPSGFTRISNISAAVSSILDKYTLKRREDVHTFTPEFPIHLGPYTNLKIVGTPLSMTTVYHYLEDSNGNRLGDHYLTYFVHNDNGSKPTATRTLSGSKMATVTLSGSDLYGFDAVVQKYNSDASFNWVDTSATVPFDPAFNNLSTFTLYGDNGTIDLTADISNVSSAVLDQPYYYISLSTANNASSYSAIGYRWTADSMTTFSYDVFSNDTTVPAGYTAIPVSTMVEFTSPDSGNYNTQPNVTITVTDTEGGFEWAKFVTSNDNATSNFNIWYAARPVFKVTEHYGTYGFTDSNTFSLMAYDATNLPIMSGILLRFNQNTAAGDNGVYRLLGDCIEAILYDGYAAGTGNYRSVTEVTPESGLIIGQGDTTCRHIELAYYRGNSVIYYPGNGSTTDSYEEFIWNRTLTTISFALVVGNQVGSTTTYIDYFGGEGGIPTYNGAIHTSSNLYHNTTSFDLNLHFYSSYSRFATGTLSYNSNINAYTKSLPIEVTFGSYRWFVYNPDNEGADQAGLGFSDKVKHSYSSSYISTNQFTILSLVGVTFVAGKVKVDALEAYSIENTIEPVKLYYSSDFIGDVKTSVTWQSEPFQTIDKIQFNSGSVAIKVPGTNTASWLSISRNSSAPTSHTGYFVLPRPQFAVTAIKSNNVSSLPFNSTTTTKTTKFFDMDMSTVSGNWTTTNVTPFSGVSNIDNMRINLKSSLSYANRINNANTIAATSIYIPSNKVTIKIALGTSTNSSTFANSLIATLYDGYIHNLNGSISYTDNTKNVTTYISGLLNSNKRYDIKFNQPVTPFSGVNSEVVHGSLGAEAIQNIWIDNISPFMTRDDDINQRSLVLYAGQSVQFSLYGHTYESSGSTLVAKIVKYTNAVGFNFTNIDSGSGSAMQFFLRNFKFIANKKYTATVEVRNGARELPNTPFKLKDDAEVAAGALSSLTWVEDTTAFTRLINPEPTSRSFDLTALSKKGVGVLAGILGATYNSPFRMTVFSYPPFVDIRSQDGSPLYVVNAFGTLYNLKTHTKVVELVSTSGEPSYITEEYAYYNNLLNNAM